MKIKIYIALLGITLTSFSCKKLIEVDPPSTSLTADAIFSTNEGVIASMTQLYASAASSSLENGSILGLSYFPGLSSDELSILPTTPGDARTYNYNSFTDVGPSGPATSFWDGFYITIYNCNRIIEGLNGAKTSEDDPASKLSAGVKRQILAEAKFMRAFHYFYLVQMYSDVPLLTTTDYRINSTLGRTNKELVYQQITTDLIDASENLANGYLLADVTTITTDAPRIRPIKWAAKSMLARVYLYLGKYAEAEIESKAVIDNVSLYSLKTSLDDIFKVNSTEAIWQLQPVTSGRNTQEAFGFTLPVTGPGATSFMAFLNPTILNAFESGDKRRTSWVNSLTVNGTTYYYPFKYKANIISTTASTTEYSTILRLAEQYLICAEARANLGNISGSQEMLNLIRKRAGLGNTLAGTKEALVTSILAERRVELFTESGHRWFDLKRLDKIDEVMRLATPLKSGLDWQPHQAYYPVRRRELNLNLNVSQTPGY